MENLNLEIKAISAEEELQLLVSNPLEDSNLEATEEKADNLSHLESKNSGNILKDNEDILIRREISAREDLQPLVSNPLEDSNLEVTKEKADNLSHLESKNSGSILKDNEDILIKREISAGEDLQPLVSNSLEGPNLEVAEEKADNLSHLESKNSDSILKKTEDVSIKREISIKNETQLFVSNSLECSNLEAAENKADNLRDLESKNSDSMLKENEYVSINREISPEEELQPLVSNSLECSNLETVENKGDNLNDIESKNSDSILKKTEYIPVSREISFEKEIQLPASNSLKCSNLETAENKADKLSDVESNNSEGIMKKTEYISLSREFLDEGELQPLVLNSLESSDLEDAENKADNLSDVESNNSDSIFKKTEYIPVSRQISFEKELQLFALNSLQTFNLEAVAQKADILKAWEYRNCHSIMKKTDSTFSYYSVYSVSLEELGEYGSGIELYFKLIKALCVIFFVISCISICPIYFNSQGSGLNAGNVRQKWDTLAISNTDIVFDSSDKEDNERRLFQLFICDAIYTGFFLVSLVILQVMSSKTIKKNLKKNLTLADFSVKVIGLPEYDVDEESVKAHFEQFGPVHEVFLARRYNGLLKAYRERALISNELRYWNLQKQFGKKVDKKIAKLKKKVSKFDEKIRKSESESIKTHDELPVIKAFVVFKDLHSRKNCFLEYKKDKGFCRRLKNQKRTLKYKEHYPLKVGLTAAPTNILYENIEVSKCSRFNRRIVSLFCVFLVLLASIAMVYSLKMYQDDLPSNKDCATVNPDYSLEEAKDLYISKTDIYCYCKKQIITDIVNDSDLFVHCAYFVQRISTTVSIRVGVSIGVIFINEIIQIIFRLLVKYERVSNKSQEQLKLMSKVFLATFINTVLVILAVNADFSELRTQNWLPKFIFNADYEDFSRMWYVEVGSTIVSTMIISIFLPHCEILLVSYPFGLCKRHCCTKRYVTQAEANMKFLGADFDLATKNSFVMNVVFTCFLFSGGMPIMNIICFLAMLVLYWVEKFLILRHYKRPPMYNHLLHERVISYLPYAVIFHCGFSLYMYGATDVFPMHVNDDGTYGINTLGDRISRITGFVNIIIIFCAAFTLIWIFFYSKIFGCILKRRATQVLDEKIANGNLEDSLESIRTHGLESYDIQDHPEYKELVKSMNFIAK